jgi:hypothetical protein
VSFAFRDIVVGHQDRASRAVIDLVIDGHDNAPQAFLIDTGAGAVRMSAEIGRVLGIPACVRRRVRHRLASERLIAPDARAAVVGASGGERRVIEGVDLLA